MSRIAALDKYIGDDIRRHGNRLSELEKKITNVYQEFTATEAVDDDTLFANEDDEEEESAFVMYVFLPRHFSGAKLTRWLVLRGQFTDDIGEDFLGLRELGIAAELGLSSLSVPKRLLKGKRNAKGPNATYGMTFHHHLILTHAFIDTAQSLPNLHRRIPHHSRWFHLPRRPSRTR